mgnify:CR=1 FL=1
MLAGKKVNSVMYEIDVTGYDNQCNTLKLFDLDTVLKTTMATFPTPPPESCGWYRRTFWKQ